MREDAERACERALPQMRGDERAWLGVEFGLGVGPSRTLAPTRRAISSPDPTPNASPNPNPNASPNPNPNGRAVELRSRSDGVRAHQRHRLTQPRLQP